MVDFELEEWIGIGAAGVVFLVAVLLIVWCCCCSRRSVGSENADKKAQKQAKQKKQQPEDTFLREVPEGLGGKKVKNPIFERTSFMDADNTVIAVHPDVPIVAVTQKIESTDEPDEAFLQPVSPDGNIHKQPTHTTIFVAENPAAIAAADEAASSPPESPVRSPTDGTQSFGKSPRGSMKRLHNQLTHANTSEAPPEQQQQQQTPASPSAEETEADRQARKDRMAAIRAAREKKKQDEWQSLVQALSLIDDLPV